MPAMWCRTWLVYSVLCRLTFLFIFDNRHEWVSQMQSLTTAAGILQTRLAGFFAVPGSIPSFICKFNRSTVRHWRRDVICLAHHGRQSVWQQKPPSSVAWVCESVIQMQKQNLLLLLTQASWLHAKGTSLQKQVYRGRTVLYMVVNTRGSLLPSSWPLCLCVAFLHPLRVAHGALRKATCDKLFFFLWSFTAVGKRLYGALMPPSGKEYDSVTLYTKI